MLNLRLTHAEYPQRVDLAYFLQMLVTLHQRLVELRHSRKDTNVVQRDAAVSMDKAAPGVQVLLRSFERVISINE